MNVDQSLKYISHYPAELLAKIQPLIQENRLGDMLKNHYPEPHQIRTDKALYDYIMGLKKEYMRQSVTINKVRWDDRISVLMNALGQHRFLSRPHGKKVRALREIRISSVFKIAPLPFLKMISVHELAHLREKEHNKAFYRLCQHMEPDYHRIEFDMRLFLTYLDLFGSLYDSQDDPVAPHEKA